MPDIPWSNPILYHFCVHFLGPAVDPQVCASRAVDVGSPFFAKDLAKTRAVLVGINYFGTSSELGGCINDARDEYKVLVCICARFYLLWVFYNEIVIYPEQLRPEQLVDAGSRRTNRNGCPVY